MSRMTWLLLLFALAAACGCAGVRSSLVLSGEHAGVNVAYRVDFNASP